MYSATDGFYYNVADPAPGTGRLAPRDSREGQGDGLSCSAARCLWNPTRQFSARLKLNFVARFHRRRRELPDDLVPGRRHRATGHPVHDRRRGLQEGPHLTRRRHGSGGVPRHQESAASRYNEITQKYGTLELNYHPSQGLTATSVTAYYNLRSENLDQHLVHDRIGPGFAVQNLPFKRARPHRGSALEQRLRLAAQLHRRRLLSGRPVSDRIKIIGNQALPFGLPPVITDGTNMFGIKTYSAFGQLRWKIAPKLELAGGVRYTDEKRNEQQSLFGVPVIPPTPRIHSPRPPRKRR